MHARHRSRFVLGLLLALVACTARAIPGEITVEEIPTPRPTGWAVDLTHTLPPERLAELNQLGDQIKEKTGAEMAVVVVSSTNGVDAHEFATRLFNTWGIGERGKENGLLVFAALADHKAEIVLGRGLDTETGRRESEAVMQGEIIPRFRAGNPAGAVILGAIACARRILHASPISTGLELEGVPETTSYAPAETPAPAVTDDSQQEQAPGASLRPYSQATVDPAKYGGGITVGIVFFSLGALLLVGLTAFRAPRCPKCKEKMTKLDEQADDAYLESAEKVEERIGSVDHQVWECPACGERKKRQGSVSFSSYEPCPECGAKTLSSSSRTVEEATYSHGGLVETEENCANCSYSNRYTRTMARLEEPTSSSSSSSSSPSRSFSSGASSAGSSSSDSSSGSSSSSGYSGGSSSGGGASGSW